MDKTDICVGKPSSQSIMLAGTISPDSAISLPASTALATAVARDTRIWCSSWDSHSLILAGGA